MGDLINGRTPEEIKYGLRCGVTGEHECLECAYYGRIDEETGLRNFDCSEIDRDALAYIERLESKQPKWISVKDRLPEVYGTYLTFTQCPKGNWIETNIYEHREERWEHDCGYHTEDVTDWITHWMPLPEPPKEVE